MWRSFARLVARDQLSFRLPVVHGEGSPTAGRCSLPAGRPRRGAIPDWTTGNNACHAGAERLAHVVLQCSALIAVDAISRSRTPREPVQPNAPWSRALAFLRQHGNSFLANGLRESALFKSDQRRRDEAERGVGHGRGSDSPHHDDSLLLARQYQQARTRDAWSRRINLRCLLGVRRRRSTEIGRDLVAAISPSGRHRSEERSVTGPNATSCPKRQSLCIRR